MPVTAALRVGLPCSRMRRFARARGSRPNDVAETSRDPCRRGLDVGGG